MEHRAAKGGEARGSDWEPVYRQEQGKAQMGVEEAGSYKHLCWLPSYVVISESLNHFVPQFPYL